jgi:hypothetical protein
MLRNKDRIEIKSRKQKVQMKKYPSDFMEGKQF